MGLNYITFNEYSDVRLAIKSRALIKYFKLVTCILRAVKRATLMFKSSPRLSKQVDYLLNLVSLLETFDSIIDLLEEGAPVDIFYFDFKKAFDRVPHNRLIYKLKCLGIDGNLLDVIKDFLTGRTLRVSVEGKLSSIKDVLSGIPQGSVLGP